MSSRLMKKTLLITKILSDNKKLLVSNEIPGVFFMFCHNHFIVISASFPFVTLSRSSSGTFNVSPILPPLT